MKWYYPTNGQKRHRKGFLWLPKTIQSEKRWLEYAEWTEEYIAGRTGGFWESYSWSN
jgi:hypothetical protein